MWEVYTSRGPLWKCSCQIFNVFFILENVGKIKRVKTFFYVFFYIAQRFPSGADGGVGPAGEPADPVNGR